MQHLTFITTLRDMHFVSAARAAPTHYSQMTTARTDVVGVLTRRFILQREGGRLMWAYCR